MTGLNDVINALNGIVFSNYTVYALLFSGVAFTVSTGFGQFRALTHGVAVVRALLQRFPVRGARFVDAASQ